MNTRGNSNSEWYRLAELGAYSAHTLFESYRKPLEICCYLTQQSAEKLLKGFLVENGTEPPKIHDLLALNTLCEGLNSNFNLLANDLADINTYSVKPRYPQITDKITEEDVRQAIKSLNSVIDFFEKYIFNTKENQHGHETKDTNREIHQ